MEKMENNDLNVWREEGEKRQVKVKGKEKRKENRGSKEKGGEGKMKNKEVNVWREKGDE